MNAGPHREMDRNQMDGSEEKREFSRVHDTFNVRLVVKDAETRAIMSEIHGSQSINISGNGLLLNMDRNMEPGITLNVVFLKPRTFDLFKGTGRIVRVEKAEDGTYNVGIQFVDLPLEDKHNLNSCLIRS